MNAVEPYMAVDGGSNYRKVIVAYDLCLHFSYSTLVGIGVGGTNFISEKYTSYSNTTQRHIEALHNRVVISQQLFEETLKICLPAPPAQTKDWLLERSRREWIATPY